MYKNHRNRTLDYQQKENLFISSNNILCLYGILSLDEASKKLGIPKDLIRQIWETGDVELLNRYIEQNTQEVKKKR